MAVSPRPAVIGKGLRGNDEGVRCQTSFGPCTIWAVLFTSSLRRATGERQGSDEAATRMRRESGRRAASKRQESATWATRERQGSYKETARARQRDNAEGFIRLCGSGNKKAHSAETRNTPEPEKMMAADGGGSR